jgi:type I restriction-modification system DNA methylase subunit
MAAPREIIDLIERFTCNHDAYRSREYNETETRREFIDPFFKALGWDIDNEQGYAEAYKDVVHEDAIKVGGATKAPDYAFRIGGVRKFFVEAKRPGVDIKNDPEPAYQLRRYAWSAKLPLSILTDFEELAVYDCRIKPNQADKASVARVLYFTYTEYEARWDEIAAIFSREAILKGSFDKYVESTKKKRGTAEVDDAFLKEIENWRDLLARNIANRNRALSNREVNFAVQRTIDRIIFLRICEDRGIEDYGQLRALQNGSQVYLRLCQIFRRADERYNSGLFHFNQEKDRTDPPDDLTLNLTIDDKVLKEIFKGLYYPESPFEFSVLPADILGHIYEQFLGKVIRLTPGHRAKVEDKPEVKKAGGVYYTPTYIVDYIVKNTVGKLLERKTPRQVPKLRILDPACGSGSFLLGAYQYLLDWHQAWYANHDPEKHAKGRSPRLYRIASPLVGEGQGEGAWRLTTAEKKRILLNNIYGVDIDPQAVEVTKLSLLLKVLEGENAETLGKSLRLFHERALPDLGDNIKCGNSLIGPDFYEGKQLSLLDDEARYRINAFDWNAEFSEIMKTGGFDVVIGNPPYIRIQAMKEWAPIEVEFYKRRYAAASKGNYDIYVVFVERVLQLLNEHGRMGFIMPHKFFQAKYGQSLRELISSGNHLSEVVHFGDQQVFAGASTYTCLLFLNKTANKRFRYVKVHDLNAWRANSEAIEGEIRADKVTEKEWNFVAGPGAELFERLGEMPVKLENIATRLAQGIRTSANEVYVLDLVTDDGKLVQAYSKKLDRIVVLERESTALFLKGREIKPYQILPSGQIVIIPYRVRDGRTTLIPEKEFEQQFPNTHTYLQENKSYLEERERGRMKGPYWYGYVYPKNVEVMSSTKILVPDIANRASFALDEGGDYAFTSGYGITLRPDVQESPKYVLALLNSLLLDFYLKRISTTMRGGFFRYFTQFIERLPICTIDFSDPTDKTRYDRMVELVETMLKLHKNLQAAKTNHEKSLIQRQIDVTDKQIDQLVYELYDLTEEEIRIVEETTK